MGRLFWKGLGSSSYRTLTFLVIQNHTRLGFFGAHPAEPGEERLHSGSWTLSESGNENTQHASRYSVLIQMQGLAELQVWTTLLQDPEEGCKRPLGKLRKAVFPFYPENKEKTENHWRSSPSNILRLDLKKIKSILKTRFTRLNRQMKEFFLYS